MFLDPIEVFDRMKAALSARSDSGDAVRWTFNGQRVCLRGWKALHFLGSLAEKLACHHDDVISKVGFMF